MSHVPRQLRQRAPSPAVSAVGAGLVKWPAIDRVLTGFSAESLLPLLSAAIDSPFYRDWERHLVLLWVRVLQRPPHGPNTAGPGQLYRLISATASAVPRGPSRRHTPDADPRQVVRFPLGGRRLRVHPGDYLNAPMLLRTYAATAAAINPAVLERHGFTLTDVMEVVLGHADRVATALSSTWPSAQIPAPASGPPREPLVSAGEIDVWRAFNGRDAQSVLDACSHPGRAAIALSWLTRSGRELRVATEPDDPLLGATLVADCGSSRVFVPAALTLATLSEAIGVLAAEASGSESARKCLQSLTALRADQLLNGRTVEYSRAVADIEVDQSGADRAAVVAQPQTSEAMDPEGDGVALSVDEPQIYVGDRFATAVVSGVDRQDLSKALRQADSRLAELAVSPQPEASISPRRGPAKLVVYGGPGVVRVHAVTDTVRVHVEELAEILADCRGEQALLIGFIEELATHPGIDHVITYDVLDAWIAWRSRGLLVPVPLEGGVLEIPDLGADLPWRRAVGWGLFDRMLAYSGYPESIDWPAANLLGDQADLFATDVDLAIAAMRDPPVLLAVVYSDADQLGMHRDGLFGLADGVRITVGRHPDIAAHLRLDDGAPLTLSLRLGTEATPRGLQGPRVGVGMDPSRALVEITLGPDILELFLNNPSDGHHVIGAAIHHAVAALRAERDDAPGTPKDVFHAAWDACPPVITLSLIESGAPEIGLAAPLVRPPHLTMRVLRDIAAENLRRNIPVGTFSGLHARQIIRDYLLPSMKGLLQQRIEACRPELLDRVVRHLSDAHALRHKERISLARTLAGPFAENWTEHALTIPEPARATRPLEVLLELILAYPPRGQEFVDVATVAELATLVDELLETTGQAKALESNLHNLTIQVLDNGLTRIETPQHAPTDEVGRQGLNENAYMKARRAQQVILATTTPPETSAAGTLRAGSRQPAAFTPLAASADDQLLEADRLLRDEWGTGLDGIRAVLSTLRSWPTGEDRFSRVERNSLEAEIVAWSGLGADVVHAAVETLLLRGDDLRNLNPADFVEVERRAHRIGLRPLPAVDGKVLVVPWLAEATAEILLSYLGDGRLPHPTKNIPEQVRQILESRRQAGNIALEDEIRTSVDGLGLSSRLRFTEADGAAAGIPNLPGEIDLLIADPDHGRLWVCEIKDPFMAYSMGPINRRIAKFTKDTKDKGHVTKLLEKAAAIERHASAAAAACQQHADLPWRVVPLLVTRWVEPAAFVANPRVAFTVPEYLAEVLRSPLDPGPGFVPAIAENDQQPPQ